MSDKLWDEEYCRTIVKFAPELVSRQDKDGNTALHNSLPTALIVELVKAGADVNVPNRNGWTPLHCAAYNSGKEQVALLVKLGGDIEALNNYERTPLALAAGRGFGAVGPLLELGANVNAQDVDGRTPLIRAAEVGHWTVIGDLLNHNADDTILDNDGNSALQCAERRLGLPSVNQSHLLTDFMLEGVERGRQNGRRIYGHAVHLEP